MNQFGRVLMMAAIAVLVLVMDFGVIPHVRDIREQTYWWLFWNFLGGGLIFVIAYSVIADSAE